MAPEANLSAAGTVLYLAYGSNLCDEKFRGDRKVKPLSAINVQVPELRLTFDLPGVPYTEPCFANTARRDAEADAEFHTNKVSTSPLLGSDYHKDRWQKGLIGTVYEVTKEDYANIIATEGGGASYKDVLVDCFKVDDDVTAPVPAIPKGTPFKAHTLFAPIQGGHLRPPRPDPSYAQPSARYLKLINDGARQRGLPLEYQSYLVGLRPYTATTARQKMGSFVFSAIWGPLILTFFSLTSLFKDKKGRAPGWVSSIASVLFGTIWVSYDNVFKPLFGDGERTEPLEEDDWEHLTASEKLAV